MARARQLPSGAWRVQVIIDGKRESITRDTEDEANYAALELKLEYKRKLENVTVGEAIDAYINARDGVLSPTTIYGYRKMRRNYLKSLMDVPINTLTESAVQRAFNDEAKKVGERGSRRSPKTLANMRGLVTAALGEHGLAVCPTIPAKQKTIKELLPPQQIFEAVKGTVVELPALLAMWLSLSMSEIRGLTVGDVKDGYLTVRHVIVDAENEHIKKDAVKAFERARKLEVPEYLLELIKGTEAWKNGSGHLTELSGEAIYERWKRCLKKAGLPHMTFHDLRHVNASVMLMLGVPDKYAMERGGWKTPSVIKNVYQHTYSNEREAVDKKINAFFQGFIK